MVIIGWKRERIKDSETIAEHSFQLTIMALVFADYFAFHREKLITMTILHDLAGELVTGDLDWSRGKIIDLEKQKIKEAAVLSGIVKIFNIIGKAEEFKSIFEEMIERKTLEAKIFWQLDKLEMAIQALKYEKENKKILDEFFINADLHLTSPFLRRIFKEVLKKAAKYLMHGVLAIQVLEN